ncbi:MAG: dihydrofolate reductase family protein [Candidatus Dormiibacterota bacterium]
MQNSTLLDGDAVGAVAKLKKQRPDEGLVILGSGELVQSVMRRNLIDEYVLPSHPLVPGSGCRLFAEGVSAKLRLIDTFPTTTGW